jgi:transcription factor SPN1
MQIEAILKPKKANRPRKKKNNDEVLDSFADDEVARLREAMLHAADEDIRANGEKLPATAKLRLLPEAMETLRKSVLHTHADQLPSLPSHGCRSNLSP